jgi:hypothetical protein
VLEANKILELLQENKNTATANGLLSDKVPRFYQCVLYFKNVVPFHGKSVM